MRIAAAVALLTMTLAQGCQSDTAAPVASGKSAALRNMEQVAIAAHRCWFASGDPAFNGYSFANELNSFSGRPRFLLVPKSDFGGKPLLVVQAEGQQGRVSAFGPLMDGQQGGRIAADISRWASGDDGCGSAA